MGDECGPADQTRTHHQAPGQRLSRPQKAIVFRLDDHELTVSQKSHAAIIAAAHTGTDRRQLEARVYPGSG